jgi:DNA-binding transcriptional LysR family regulator
MAKRPYQLPSLKALAAFEAAARHLSFREAAQEINVTPGAISHQVKALEKELGHSLFHRAHRGVALTSQGDRLFAILRKGFSDISAVWDDLSPKTTARGVTICATTAVSSLWLTSRLVRFWQAHPEIAVNQQVTDDPRAEDRYDLWIAYGDVHDPTAIRTELFRDTLIPLCSPSFAQEHIVPNLTGLASLPLIHLEASDARWTTWRRWFDQLGHTGQISDGPRMNNYISALQAAQEGAGLVLGWQRLVQPLLASGQLVAFTKYRQASPEAFHLFSKSGAQTRADIETLKSWLMDHL